MPSRHTWDEVTETDDPREQSAHETDLRAAYTALRRISPGQPYDPAPEDMGTHGLVADFDRQLEAALAVVDAELGPLVSWVETQCSPGPEWNVRVLQVDFDEGAHDLPEDGWTMRPDGWRDSGFARAARAYRREGHWDHSPDETGIWVLAVAPAESSGTEDKTTWVGNLVGFVILQDRDEDGEYESLAHVWTAQGWRRRGIAAALIDRARQTFPVLKAEGPFTEDGGALVAAVAPDLG